ncbi:uncharacterized protein LOC117107533 isoform X2 [Anneissia japonica]|uniref:uncharacterized protein LOC117107533 isoform X2 n=1 Tax=Anneissia japonica TaxID=1529436 RepID=UPI0014258C4B|nr:uncharacterized protein LOC117107533 isoform X2 [Anneissia japonica]
MHCSLFSGVETKRIKHENTTGEVGTGMEIEEAEELQVTNNTVEDETDWESQVIKGLQMRKKNVKCLSSKDHIPGKLILENLIEPVKKCKRVVVGFRSEAATESAFYVAASALTQTLNDQTLTQGKLIPVRISEDARIPECLALLITANWWKDDFYDKLLQSLSQQDDVMTEIPNSELTKMDNGKFVWKRNGKDSLNVSISSSHISTMNFNELKALMHENIEVFKYFTYMPNGNPVAVFHSQCLSLQSFKFVGPDPKKQKVVMDIAHGLKYLHKNRIKHGNLNLSTVIVNGEGHAKIREFDFQPRADDGDLQSKLIFLAEDVGNLGTVIYYVLTGRSIKKQKTYVIPGYANYRTTGFFNACLDDDLLKRPPVLEIWYWLHGLFNISLPNAENEGRATTDSFRVKKKKVEIKCQSCPGKKKIIEELAVTHNEKYDKHDRDVHYCTSVNCIRRKFHNFNGEVIYDSKSNPLFSIKDIVTLKSKGFKYHGY